MSNNLYLILLRLIQITDCVLLFIVPLIYTIIKGRFKKGFIFTWAVWAIVCFIFGLLMPLMANITEKAAVSQELDVPPLVTALLGILIGWWPALLIASFGIFIRFIIDIIIKNFKNIKSKGVYSNEK